MRYIFVFLLLSCFSAAGQCNLQTSVDPISKNKTVKTQKAKLQHGMQDKWETLMVRVNDADEIGIAVTYNYFKPMPGVVVTPDDLLIFQTENDSLIYARPISTNYSSYNAQNRVTSVVVMYTISIDDAKFLASSQIVRIRLSATETHFDLDLKSDKARNKLLEQLICITQ